jgi:hypothetical protein
MNTKNHPNLNTTHRVSKSQPVNHSSIQQVDMAKLKENQFYEKLEAFKNLINTTIVRRGYRGL